MADHPPIPPNHPRFFERNGCTYFDKVGPIDLFGGKDRETVAAVAEVAWRKAFYEKTRGVSDNYVLASCENSSIELENAHAWRRWGDQS